MERHCRLISESELLAGIAGTLVSNRSDPFGERGQFQDTLRELQQTRERLDEGQTQGTKAILVSTHALRRFDEHNIKYLIAAP